MLPRENKNNAYAKLGGTNKGYYGILQNGQLFDGALNIPGNCPSASCRNSNLGKTSAVAFSKFCHGAHKRLPAGSQVFFGAPAKILFSSISKQDCLLA